MLNRTCSCIPTCTKYRHAWLCICAIHCRRPLKWVITKYSLKVTRRQDLQVNTSCHRPAACTCPSGRMGVIKGNWTLNPSLCCLLCGWWLLQRGVDVLEQGSVCACRTSLRRREVFRRAERPLLSFCSTALLLPWWPSSSLAGKDWM